MDAVEGISGALANSPNSQEYPRMLVRSTNSAPNKDEMDSARRAERSYSYIRVLSNNEASKPERQIPLNHVRHPSVGAACSMDMPVAVIAK